MEAERLVAQSTFDNFFETDKRAAADEENVGRVDREEFLVWMFATTLRWNIRDRAFEDLQQRLLHAFTRHIASDRRVLILTTNLVYFINVDDSLLCAFDVAVGSLQQFQNDVLDVFTNVARFSQCCRIDDRERNSEHARERLREQRLARSGRPDQQNVCFLNLDVRTTATEFDALVVLIDGDGQALLRFILADHIFVQEVFDLSGLRQRRASGY